MLNSITYLHRCGGEDQRPGDCDIVFYQSAYQRITQHLAADLSREQGGLLLGYEEHRTESSRSRIYIVDALEAKYGEEAPAHLAFTHETWAEFDRAMQARIPDPKLRRLGWYHSHPKYGVFLSPHDLYVCSTYFPQPAHVALVVDPIKSEGGFFVNGEEGYRSQSPQGFWEYTDIQPDSLVNWKNLISVPQSSIKPSTNKSLEPLVNSASKVLSPTKCLRVFLCHSSNDKTAVRELYRRLSSDGIAPWLDEENLLPGQEWEQEIPKAVRSSDVVLVCLSQKSVNKSGYVQKEIKFALDIADEQPEGTIFLIPLRIDDCDVPNRLRRWHWVNLFEERGYERLMLALQFRATKLGLIIG